MKKLYAPWRSKYTESVIDTKKEDPQKSGCIFCTVVQDTNDAQCFVLARFEHVFVMLNKYPYNAGHLLIVPYIHTGPLDTLNTATLCQIIELAAKSTTILTKIINPEGFNIGCNLGKAAGAGIPFHIHMHLLPRWSGDTNFLPTLGQTKTISLNLAVLYNDLYPHFQNLLKK